MPFTDEQRKKAAETRERNREARLANGNAPTAATATLEPPAPAADETANELKRLAATLFSAADKKEQRDNALGDLEAFLARLSPKDFPDLADSPVVQQFVEMLGQRKAEMSPDDPPGTEYNRGTMAATSKPWTFRDLENSDIPIIEFEFDSFEDVYWQGLRRTYQPGVTYRDWRCFPDLVREGRKNMRLGNEHVQYLMKQANSLSDPSIAGIGTARVRGTADVGTYGPAAGLFTPDYEAGMTQEDGEGGEAE